MHRYTSGPASGSSRALSGYDTSSNSISGYSKVDFKETRGGKAYASSIASDATSATGGVKLATPSTKIANAGKMLTPNNLATIEKDSHVTLFERLHVSNAPPETEGGSDEGSDDDDFDRCTTTTATGEAPRKPPSVAVSLL